MNQIHEGVSFGYCCGTLIVNVPKNDIVNVCGTLGFVFRFEGKKMIMKKKLPLITRYIAILWF
jgi:hypothetical protein